MAARDSDQPEVRLQIHDVEPASADQLIAVVRCVAGPIRLGARFRHSSQASPAIDLTLTKIAVYHADVNELAHGWTARVTLTGTGAQAAYPGLILEGRNLET